MPRRFATLAELPDGSRVSGTLGTCQHCGARILGRSDATYCGSACRMAHDRAEAKATADP